jgi:hypothetical protein
VELLSQRVDIAVSSSTTMNTPLHFASLNNNKAIVEVLLRSGADPSVPNADGMIAAELTTDASIRESLMNTNWMSQTTVYPSASSGQGQEQDGPRAALRDREIRAQSNEQEQHSQSESQSSLERSRLQRPVVPPLTGLLAATESSGASSRGSSRGVSGSPKQRSNIGRGRSDDTALRASQGRIGNSRAQLSAFPAGVKYIRFADCV